MNEIAESIRWGYPTLVHYFLAGLGGGTLTISAIALILNRRHGNLFSIARYAALIAPLVIFDDVFVLILELGRPSRFLNIFTHVNFESPLWIGAWLMAIFLVVSTVLAYTYLGLPKSPGRLRGFLLRLGVQETPRAGDKRDRLRWTMTIIGLPLGIGVCHYPGFMMSGLVARPLWSTAILPTVTLLSGIVTGLAAILLCRVLIKKITDAATQQEYRENNYLLSLSIVIVLMAEFFVLAQVMIFATNTDSSLQHVMADLFMSGGLMVQEFWIGVVGVGFVVPLMLGLVLVVPRLVFAREYEVHKLVEASMPLAVLTGALMLIYVLLFGGQITGPIGI